MWKFLRPLSMVLHSLGSQIVDRRLRKFGRIPLSTRAEDDIYLIGFPKSGHNWMQNILTGLIYGLSPAALPDSLVQELIPDLDYHKHYCRYFKTCTFRTHDLPRPEFRRVIYLLRDPRDVFVSLLHFRPVVTGETLEPDDLLKDPDFSGHAWRRHVESWLSNPYDAELLPVKYEDLLRDPEQECRRILQFLDISRPPEQIASIVAETSFERLRKKEERFGKANPPRWPGSKRFYRRGEVGSHKDELPPSIVEALLEQVGPTLKTCGY